MVCMASRGSAKKLLRTGSRIAGRFASDWNAVYVETPSEEPGRIAPHDHAALMENFRFAEHLGAQVVKLKGDRVADALIEFARKEGITHVIFVQSGRSRWDIFWRLDHQPFPSRSPQRNRPRGAAGRRRERDLRPGARVEPCHSGFA